MALTITHFPDIRAYLGESAVLEVWNLQPAAADYVTGGYPIPAGSFQLGKIVGAVVIGTNSAGATYLGQFVLPTTPLTTPQNTINFKVVYSAGAAGVFTEVPAGTDLSAISWNVLAWGW
jgi:hypothetical protein